MHLDAYDTGRPFCSSAAPRPFCEASHCSTTSSSGSKYASTCPGCLHSSCFMFVYAFFITASQMNSLPFFVISLNGAVISDRLDANFPRYVAMPSIVCSSSFEAGGGMFWMPCVFAGSGCCPLADRMCPKYVT